MSKFVYIAKPFIVPATTRSNGTIFDIESDGLLDTVAKVHCIVVRDLESDRVDEYGPGQIDAALAHLSRADCLINHNIVGYDLPLLHKLYNWTPKTGCAIVDTLIASRTILPHIDDLDDQAAGMGDPKLGKLRGRYNLEAWGARLGIPKVGADITDWSQWTPEMQARCVGDTALVKALYRFLQIEGYSAQAIELEHRVAPICDRITADGVPFDRAAAERLHQQWVARLTELKTTLQEQFPGTNLNSRAQIGRLLEARGWVPKKRTEKTGQPKIDDEVLETIPALYPEFAGIAEHDLLRRRIAQLATGDQAWLKHIGEDGRIHGALIHIGTPHSRAKHFAPNIAQVPNAKKGGAYAAECRALFKHPGDWVFVCCDQSNLQDRAFAHHLAEFDGGAYARDFLAGVDKHWQNAGALGLVPAGTERNKESKLHAAVREGAKTFRYGFLFGAGVGRCGEILTETVRAVQNIEPSYTAPTDGKRARDRFIAATPGLARLRNKLEAQVTRQQWLPGLDGRRVPTQAQYTALNYALASIEAIVCKRWLANVYDELYTRFHYGWDGDVVICLWVHDEIAACCKPQIAGQVGEILVRHAKEAGEHYGLKVPLNAEYKIGRSWAGEPLNDDAPPEPAAEPDGLVELIGTVDNDAEIVGGDIEPDDGDDIDDADLDDAEPDIRADPGAIGALVAEAGYEQPDRGELGAAVCRMQAGIQILRTAPPLMDIRGPGYYGGNGSGAGATIGSNGSNGGAAINSAASAPATDPELGPYIYRDARSGPHAKVVRTPNGNSRFTQQHWTGAAWQSGMSERKLPYRLPELLAADPAAWVCITEGEKDAVNVAKLGLVATTNPNGAKGWNSAKLIPYFVHLRRIAILEDNDAAGRERTKRIIKTLRILDPMPDIRVVSFPELPDGGDVSDWLAQDRSRGRAELLARIEAVPAGESIIEAEPYKLPTEEQIAPWDWLYGHLLLRGEVSGTVAMGGTGKSSSSIVEALAMASGISLLGAGVPKPLRVVLVNLEDTRNTMDKRIAAAMRYYGLTQAEIGDRLIVKAKGEIKIKVARQSRSGEVERDEAIIRALTNLMIEHQADVLSIDSFIRSHKVNENDNSAIEEVVECFEHIATEARCAVHLWHHTRKQGGEKATIESARGASSFIDAVRSARVLETMSVKVHAELKAVQPDLKAPGYYFRGFNGKRNFAPPVDESDWFKLESVELRNGDNVGVVTPWQYPATWAGLSPDIVELIMEEIDRGMPNGQRYTNGTAARTRAAYLAVQKHCPTKTQNQGRTIVATWISDGKLVEKPYDDPVQRRSQSGLFLPAPPAATPTAPAAT